MMGKPEGKRPHWRPRRRWDDDEEDDDDYDDDDDDDDDDDIIEWIFKKSVWSAWTWFSGLNVGTCGGLLWTR
jgi:hypothetical protein